MKVFKRDNVAMNVLNELGYSKARIANMFGVSKAAVTYATNDKYREHKKAYARAYAKSNRLYSK